MGVRNCFESGAVVGTIASREKYSALRELIRQAPVFHRIKDLSAFEESVITREKLQSTGFGHGVAVAHGRVPDLARVLIGLGISREGIPFDSADGKPVNLLFIIASPTHAHFDYLRALSVLVRTVRECSLREALMAADEAGHIEETIRSAFKHSLEAIEGIAVTPAT
jgi:PTS system nitrogen regulatory IIA component